MVLYWFTTCFLFLTINTLNIQAFIGEPCRYDEDCIVEHSFCEMQQICQCKHNFIETEDRETCIAMTGAYCHSKYDCNSLPNSICKDYRCDCDTGFTKDPTGSKCLPVATHIEGPCNFRNQCTPTFGANSDCIGKRCQCLQHHHFSGICLFDIGLGQQCKNHSQCYIGDTYKETLLCNGGYCTCRAGYHQTDQRICQGNGSLSHQTSLGVLTCLVILCISILANEIL